MAASMHGFDRYRRLAALLLCVGGAVALPAHGAAQEGNSVRADSAAASGTLLRTLAPPAPSLPGTPSSRTSPAVPRAFLSDSGRAGMYIGLALGAQVGAVRALTRCQRRRKGHCLESHLPSELAFTVGTGAIGAAIGTLIHRLRAAPVGVPVAAPPPVPRD